MPKSQNLIKFSQSLNNSGTVEASGLPVASSSTLGVVRVDNNTINISNGIISAAVAVTPKITSIVYPGDDTAADIVGGQTIIINGSGFASTPIVYINDTLAPSVSFVSSTQITFTTPAKSAGTYNVYVINPDSSIAIKVMGISYSGTPTWTTATGELGPVWGSFSIQLQATGDAPLVYTLSSGYTLPSGVTLSSSGLLSGTIAVDQVFNFSVDVNDAQNQSTPRSFSVTVSMSDPYYKYVSLHLTGNGTNGAQNNTFLDSSTNNFTITRNGNTTQGSFSPYGSNWGNYFDGSSYLSLSASAGLSGSGNFTLEAWIFPTVVSGQDNCIYETRGGSGWVLFIPSGTTTIQVYDSAAGLQTASSSSIILNQWNHIALVKNGSTCIYYINGVSSGSFTLSSFASATGVRIGTRNDATQSFRGYISNLRSVTSAVYTSNFTPSTTPLTAISGTSLLTCQSNRFIDNSSNNFALTVNGTPSVQRFSPFAPSSAYSTATIGGSGYFDGSGDYLSVSSLTFNPRSTVFTMEGWFYFQSSVGQAIFGSSTNVNFYLVWINGWYVGDGVINPIAAVGSLGSLNAWQYIALSFDGTTYRLYQNGVQIATSTTLLASNTVAFSFGAYNSGALPYSGYASNVRFSNTARYTGSTMTVPTSPNTSDGNTSLLLSMTNGAIYDNAMMNDLETVGNVQISTSVKKYGTGSVAFDGTGDYLYSIATPNLTLSGDFTIECWAYLSSTFTQYPTLWTLGDSSLSTGLQIQIWGTGVNLSTNNTNAAGSMTGMTNATNTWIHWAVVRSGSSIKVYKDGTFFGTTATNSASFAGVLRIGAEYYWSNLANYWFGYIDDLRITKGYARYTANFTPPTALVEK